MNPTFQSLDNFSLSQSPNVQMSNTTASRERRPSTSAPISDLQGPVGPAGVSRPKHKRTFTGFGAGEIKSVEGEFFDCIFSVSVYLVISAVNCHIHTYILGVVGGISSDQIMLMV